MKFFAGQKQKKTKIDPGLKLSYLTQLNREQTHCQPERVSIIDRFLTKEGNLESLKKKSDEQIL